MIIGRNTTRLQQGDLAWYIVKRGDRYGIRLRDHKHPRIDELDHIPSYPIQSSYVVEATLDAFRFPGDHDCGYSPGGLTAKITSVRAS